MFSSNDSCRKNNKPKPRRKIVTRSLPSPRTEISKYQQTFFKDASCTTCLPVLIFHTMVQLSTFRRTVCFVTKHPSERHICTTGCGNLCCSSIKMFKKLPLPTIVYATNIPLPTTFPPLVIKSIMIRRLVRFDYKCRYSKSDYTIMLFFVLVERTCEIDLASFFFVYLLHIYVVVDLTNNLISRLLKIANGQLKTFEYELFQTKKTTIVLSLTRLLNK